MSPAASVVAIPENSVRDLDEAYRPAGVFISYASEDHDIAQAIYQSLQALGECIYDRIKIFLDSKSIAGGDEIRADIKAGLKKSDFLVVLYTGLFKRSHGYTGWEVGFFEGLIEDEKTKSGQTTRKIIYLYSGEPPTIGEGILGVSININTTDLGGSRADYMQKSIQTPDNPDTLARTLDDIAKRAESRLPPPLSQDGDELERKRARRRKQIAEDIIPTLKGKLFDSMSMRITRRSIEQRLIEFELPKAASDQLPANIPDDAKLTPHERALDIFGIPQQNDSMSWSEFRNQVRSRDVLGGSSILLAIEQAVISAISPAISLDNDQILKSSNDQIFRVIVTRQLDYYNGRKVIQVYFIQKLQGRELGNNDTSMILGFITVAAKYRFIFIERDSQLSVESFLLEPDHTKIQNKVRQLIRELLLIEEEARNLNLDQVASIGVYYGGDDDHIATARALQNQWFEARGNLMASAENILAIPPASAEFAAANEKWLTTLKSFRQTSQKINSIVAVQAMENLKKRFVIPQ
jgi:hypothetical protein